MIAKLIVSLPFTLIVPEKQEFQLYESQDSGYSIYFYPPIKIEPSQDNDSIENILINNAPAYRANGLQINFKKDSFDRSSGIACDPPEEFISKTISWFLIRLRFVTQATQIRLIDFPHISWHLRYLNDDESELKEEKGQVRGRGARTFKFSYTAVNNSIWKDVFTLSPDYEPPQWNMLLLDANAALPEIGPSIVLGATALEVFIADILNKLAKNSTVPAELWEWLNNRGNWLKDPSMDEQLDTLLKILLGFSLKDDGSLWEAYRNLKDARNSFVHEGIASIGKGKKILSENDTRNLIQKVRKIIELIQSKLPEPLKCPVYKHDIKVSFSTRIK